MSRPSTRELDRGPRPAAPAPTPSPARCCPHPTLIPTLTATLTLPSPLPSPYPYPTPSPLPSGTSRAPLGASAARGDDHDRAARLRSLWQRLIDGRGSMGVDRARQQGVWATCSSDAPTERPARQPAKDVARRPVGGASARPDRLTSSPHLSWPSRWPPLLPCHPLTLLQARLQRWSAARSSPRQTINLGALARGCDATGAARLGPRANQRGDPRRAAHAAAGGDDQAVVATPSVEHASQARAPHPRRPALLLCPHVRGRHRARGGDGGG